MLEEKGQSIPFGLLGKRLRALRLGANETLAEASGAVEIEARELANFEMGQIRPSQEILILLLSHFGVKDDVAVSLWELAGYQSGKTAAAHMSSARALDKTQNPKTDQIIYTDIVDIMVNNYGVIMNFMQSSGRDRPAKIVSRVGMSREHAKSVLQILQITLSQTERNLPKLPNQMPSADNPQEETSQN